MIDEKIEVDLKKAIPSRKYKLRETGENGKSIETTIPRTVIEREARKRDLSVSEFIEQYKVVWYVNQFDGMHLQFEKVTKEVKEKK